MASRVKEEKREPAPLHDPDVLTSIPFPTAVIDLSSSSSSSDSDSSSDSGEDAGGAGIENGRDRKKRKLNGLDVVLPPGFLAPLPPRNPVPVAEVPLSVRGPTRQFWKAGDFEGAPGGDWDLSAGGVDHVRVHPKFLHSNATSHRWALGAFAELLDNSLDETCNGATYANIDVLENKKDGSKMLLIEDNGGGMNPEKMRQCMSLGYSAKSKEANTIGQYGNGFKTSTMRLGADVLVFSRCRGESGKGPTQSIGLLSYTFLRSTGKEDIIVPMLDYQREGGEWFKMIRYSESDWIRNVETIVQWSPFSSEVDLLRQFNMMTNQGTRIIIYNLWDDDVGLSELDFCADPHDIQLRGVNRDEKKIQMAKEFPNSRHFLTYRHSLRSYASILYLRLPPNFRIILRGKDVEHHNIVNDMMMTERRTYRPQSGDDVAPNETSMAAEVTIGFVKDARFHIDIQGFNVYHKNRLIKPFWRLWNAAGSDGRGVIGVLEANFVEPAHDKQGFERTTVLAKLEARLVKMQKDYWSKNCHKIGYAARRKKKQSEDGDASDHGQEKVSSSRRKDKKVPEGHTVLFKGAARNGSLSGKGDSMKTATKSRKGNTPEEPSIDVEDSGVFVPVSLTTKRQAEGKAERTPAKQADGKSERTPGRVATRSSSKGDGNDNYEKFLSEFDEHCVDRMKQENLELRNSLQLERDKCKSVESKLEEARNKIDELNKEQESLIDIFSEERERRDREEENLRKKLKDASNTIQELVEKVKLLEKVKSQKR